MQEITQWPMLPFLKGAHCGAPYPEQLKGGMPMVTWNELFAFGMFIIAVISLVDQLS